MFKQRNSVFIAVLHLEVTMCLFYSLSAIFVGETGTFQRHVIFRFWSDSNGIVFFELFFLVRTLNTVVVSRALVPQTQNFLNFPLLTCRGLVMVMLMKIKYPRFVKFITGWLKFLPYVLNKYIIYWIVFLKVLI